MLTFYTVRGTLDIMKDTIRRKYMLIVGDLHFSETSSLLSRGDTGDSDDPSSIRLKNMEDTIGWVISIQKSHAVIQLGDFFDKKALTGNELAILRKVIDTHNGKLKSWQVLVGNHGIDTAGDSIFALPTVIYDTPSFVISANGKNVYVFLPYILQKNRKPLKEYLDKLRTVAWEGKRVIIFSHNDIVGQIPGGAGFSIKEIEENCTLFINGHLHKREWVTSKILNVGNITGQNFSEDATEGVPGIWQFDEDSLELEFIANPYALLYAHWDFTGLNITPESVSKFTSRLPKERLLVAVTVYADQWNLVRPFVETNTFKYKLILKYRNIEGSGTTKVADDILDTEEKMSHIDKFIHEARKRYGDLTILEELK